MYLSDFGTLSVVPNRVMLDAAASRNVLVIDPDYVARGVLRSMRTEKLAKTGDAREARCSDRILFGHEERTRIHRHCRHLRLDRQHLRKNEHACYSLSDLNPGCDHRLLGECGQCRPDSLPAGPHRHLHDHAADPSDGFVV